MGKTQDNKFRTRTWY